MSANSVFISVVTSFVEKAAIAFGLGKTEALKLTLAAEEIFQHLCHIDLSDDRLVEVRCTGGGYYVRTDFTFSVTDLDMRAFNITTKLSFSDDADMEQMGLLIASRSVDRFTVVRDMENRFRLTLIKEKVYPPPEEEPVTSVKVLEKFSLRTPGPEELKLLAHLVKRYYPHQTLPDIFDYPGKLADMVQEGDLRATVVVGSSGEIGGGSLWRRIGTKAVEWFGPYLFDQLPDSGMADALLEDCIGAIARTPAAVLINQFPTSEFPRRHFEYLGSIRISAEGGTLISREAWARLMQEDLGHVVWVHPELDEFVSHEYERLVLPRETRYIKEQGEQRSLYSVLLTTFDRPHGNATIEPVWFGTDYESNLVRHLELLRREGIPHVFFILDMGQSWQADFTPGLLRNGFKPCFILPYAGAGDQVIFQLQGMVA